MHCIVDGSDVNASHFFCFIYRLLFLFCHGYKKRSFVVVLKTGYIINQDPKYDRKLENASSIDEIFRVRIVEYFGISIFQCD